MIFHNVDDSTPAITRDPISLYVQDRVDFRKIADPARDIKRRKISWHGGGDATCGNHDGGTHTPTPPREKKEARLHFSFTFASAERKITGSHYARHVGSFMSLSPGPSTFAISPPTFSTTPPPALSFVFYPFSTPILCYPPPLDERREKKILFIS